MLETINEKNILFNKPLCSTRELDNIKDVFNRGKISGDGYYTKLCNEWFLN